MAQSQRDDLQALADADITRLARVADLLEQSSPTVRLSVVRDIIGNELDANLSSSLLRWAYFLQTLASSPYTRTTSFSINDLARNFEVEISDEKIDVISRISETEIIHSAWKAQNLSRDAEHLYQGFAIVIDRRPVFNRDQTEIIGEVVMPFLKIAYTDAGDNRSVSISLDSRDIDNIYREMDKLRRKLAVIAENADRSRSFLVGDEVEFGSL